ncbi:MAG: diguanylate cyclase [Burkholderiales bacterium]|nr:diguanylate cyclase [Burkholderiales bacterium]
MRYTEDKAHSAELLRLALAPMGRQAAALNPLTYTVWYEHLAGINGGLSAEVARLEQAVAPIDDAAILRLYKDHVAGPDEEALVRIGGQMQKLMHSVEQSAARTDEQAGSYGDHLSRLTDALADPGSNELSPRLAEAIERTAKMQLSVQDLQTQVASSQTEIQRLRSELERARDEALVDPLTGVLNRKGLDRRIQALLSEPPHPGRSHCVAMFDIDHFKQVNDVHGHLVGDRVIQAVAAILRGSITDPVQSAARYGGEEFALLMPNTTAQQATEVAEAVRMRTKSMRLRDRRTQDVVLTVTISGGVAQLAPDDDAYSLMARADAALYRSKAAGRDRVMQA